MKRLIMLFIIVCSGNLSSQIRIGVLELGTDNNDVYAVYEFLQSNNDFKPKLINHKNLIDFPQSIFDFQILWLRRADSTGFTKEETDPRVISKLRQYVIDGGNLFLTLDAVKYLNLLGFETEIPTIQYADAIDDGYGRKLGLHSFRSHPIFDGLNGGVYLFNPTTDMKTRQIGFFGSSIPQNGKVVAVDWSYITLKEDSKLVVEYQIGKGKVLAVGAYTYFSIPNQNRQHLEQFTKNCLNYLAGKFDNQPKYYWSYESNRVSEFSILNSQFPISTPVKSKLWQGANESLLITNRFGSENFWNVAGERMLVMGKEKGGIDEIWAHPFMALRDYEVGLQFSYKDTVYWLNDERPQIEVRPESFTRIYKFRRAYLTEIITTSKNKPIAVLHYEYRGVYPAKLIIKFKSNMRYMWPYSEKVFGTINYAWDNSINSFIIKDDSGDHAVFVGANRKPDQQLIGQFENFEKRDSIFKGIASENISVGAFAQFNLEMNDNIDLIIAATNEGLEVTRKNFEETFRNPEKIYVDASEYSEGSLNNSLMITTPDKDFNEGYKWSLIGADRFFVNTPGLGKALVAGYSTTAKGWNGGHKVNGRPGYGWYFGRDAVWSAFALLDYGDFGKVKSQLQFFNKYQDLNGKIFHELTTSGAVHYDASDATPLYIILAGRYLQHSGDVEFIKQTWPHIKRAIDFCFSTDTDNDHLIENTNVGHGWVEGGGLYTSHTEVYLAACWAEALRMAGVMANEIGMSEESRVYDEEFSRVKNIINKDFWNEENNFLCFSKLKDGTFNPEKTVLASIPVYFDMLDYEKAVNVIDDYSENYFSSDWGVRILRDDSPIYNPRGYHTGSVWPLFTGWSSLAEFKYGSHLQGFTHLMNNLLVYKNWQLGFVEEVLHGSEYRPSGVCSHQCWSQTMILQPAIEGMLGLNVDAINNKIVLAPRFPADWDSVNVERIRIGNSFVDFLMKRKNGKTEFIFTTDSKAPIQFYFNPSFPLGTKFIKAAINNKPTTIEQFDNRTINISFILYSSTTIEISCEGGKAALPHIVLPKPNFTSEGFRILKERIEGEDYIVEVQGINGSRNQLKVWKNGKVESIAVDFEKGDENYLNKEIKIKQ
ncbi:MAG: amylo-alpha-1,6-glucosidase [Melioribacteraceae bacterium]|nr:amylo-alpha-1,6-glucosidase [Melioribacteraceae bacterium]